jgi:predicted small lipoprotein YifL
MRAPMLLVLTALMMATVMLAACGKKGPPDPPGPPNEITYPKTYPTH